MKYFVVQQNEGALCLICRNNIACLKESSGTITPDTQCNTKEILGNLQVDKAHQLKM